MKIYEVTRISLAEENMQQLIRSVKQRGVYGPAVAQVMADIHQKDRTLSNAETFQAALNHVAAEAKLKPADIENNMKKAGQFRSPQLAPAAPAAPATTEPSEPDTAPDDTEKGGLLRSIGSAARNMRDRFTAGSQTGQSIFRALDRR
jgi:hypothetical protein